MGTLNGDLLDSTILIDCLNAVSGSHEALAAASDPGMSIVTWIEVMTGMRTPEDERIARSFLDNLWVFPVSPAVAEETVRVRRTTRLKLPDAVIWATARVHGLTLVTRNTKDFPADDPWIRVPYRI